MKRCQHKPFGAEPDNGGTHFRLWAPGARRVELLLDAGHGEQNLTLTSHAGGTGAATGPGALPQRRPRSGAARGRLAATVVGSLDPGRGGAMSDHAALTRLAEQAGIESAYQDIWADGTTSATPPAVPCWRPCASTRRSTRRN
ncbi:MAG: hypothetical protein Kow0073_13210 [Immundisolibacter sp.]